MHQQSLQYLLLLGYIKAAMVRTDGETARHGCSTATGAAAASLLLLYSPDTAALHYLGLLLPLLLLKILLLCFETLLQYESRTSTSTTAYSSSTAALNTNSSCCTSSGNNSALELIQKEQPGPKSIERPRAAAIRQLAARRQARLRDDPLPTMNNRFLAQKLAPTLYCTQQF